MKKVLLITLIIFSCASLVSAGTTIKGLLGYGFLTAPSLPDFSGISDVSDSKGGISIHAQLLFGDEPLNFGAEIGYLSIYSWEYEIPSYTLWGITYGGKSSASLSAIPILGIIQYTLGDPKASFKPYIQGGLGFYLTSSSITLLGVEASDTELKLGMKLGAGGCVEINPQMGFDFSLNFYPMFVEGGASTLNLEAGIAYQL